MPIPTRFRLKAPKKALIREMCGLCTEIETAIERGSDTTELLAKWHEHATRQYDPTEFTTYWKAIDREVFVCEALNPAPKMIDDLAYSEVAAVLQCVAEGELSENETSYFIEWLDAQFPKANISDLIDWPDEWFDDASQIRNSDGTFRPESELSIDQILGYAMAKANRSLPGAPTNVTLPFPIPKKST